MRTGSHPDDPESHDALLSDRMSLKVPRSWGRAPQTRRAPGSSVASNEAAPGGGLGPQRPTEFIAEVSGEKGRRPKRRRCRDAVATQSAKSLGNVQPESRVQSLH